MPVEFFRDNGRLVWIRNPFTDVVTYFTDVHMKRSGFRRPVQLPIGLEREPAPAHQSSHVDDLETARRGCAFCPGNEHMTPEELLRVRPCEVEGSIETASPWLIRAFNNLIPRIPESCTGGRNESYVVVEDPRHFVDGARHPNDLLHTGLLSAAQVRAILHANIEVARHAYRNTAVKAVLIRKNQGYESGASQPHVHNQVIGCDQAFQPVREERERLAREPGLWDDVITVLDGEGYVLGRRDGCTLYFSPFGTFPRSYEVVCRDVRGPITEAGAAEVEAFAALLHQALRLLEPLPLDYEIHDGTDIPLHAHISARHFPYSNIGGTLNLPANLSLAAPGTAARSSASPATVRTGR